EIVEQRPVDIAPHLYPLGEAAFELGDAGVEPGDAPAVVVGADPAFGDEDRLGGLARSEADHLAERPWIIFVASRGQLRARRRRSSPPASPDIRAWRSAAAI